MYYRLEKRRELFKGGNNIRADTIQGNTVYWQAKWQWTYSCGQCESQWQSSNSEINQIMLLNSYFDKITHTVDIKT